MTVFEPVVATPDQLPRFVECPNVSVFPPVAVFDPDAPEVHHGFGEILELRADVPFTAGALTDRKVSFPRRAGDRPSNPWGLVTVYVEARGPARPSGGGRAPEVTATLAAGCYCLRTRAGTLAADGALDRRVKAACDLVDEPARRVLDLTAVPPPSFRLARCDGLGEVTAPRNTLLSPGPAVCLFATLCGNQGGNRDCFRCEQPCAELTDLSRAPVLFTVTPARQAADPDDDAQVVLTDENGRARPTIPIFDCREALTIRASVLGSSRPPVDFPVTCVDEPESFSCVEEQRLGMSDPRVIDMTVLPVSTLGGCTETEPAGCDRVVALTRSGERAVVEVRHRDPALETVRLTFEGEQPRAVHGFLYDALRRTRPALAVATAGSGASDVARLRIYAWIGGRLELVHGPDDLLVAGRCPTWRCGSGEPCGAAGLECGAGEICRAERCVDGSSCALRFPFGTSVVIEARRLDDDAFADLVVGNSAGLPVAFFYSAGAVAGRMYRAGGCECARFGQPPTAFTFRTLGGSETPTGRSDLVFGSGTGAFVKYASNLGDRRAVSCGGLVSLRDPRGVRDIAPARFRCAAGQPVCDGFEDAVILFEQGRAGSVLDDPGVIRVLYGGPTDLGAVEDPLSAPDTTLVVHPRVFENRTEARDPHRVRVADFNGDGFEDLAVLYRASREIRLWYGSGRGGLGEGRRSVTLDDCSEALEPVDEACPASAPFATPDQDGDGRAELVVSCRPSGGATLRYFEPGPSR